MSASASASEPPGDPASTSLSDAAGREFFRLLLVEDDDGDARLVEDDLAEWLPQAVLVRRRALGETISLPPSEIDCILLDLGLPDATGLDAVARLRSWMGQVPLIVLTGLDHEFAGVAAVQAGAQDYLVKGQVQGGQLARAIRYAIGRGQTEAAARELLLADAQAHETERLERGLTPTPLVLDSSIWVASCYRPGRSRALLGGDFMDLMQARDGRVHVLVGDVCGHGPDEAAVGIGLRAAWRALALAGADQAATLGTLQELFEQERHVPSLFATLCSLRIDPSRRTAEVVLAGHPRPALIDGGSVRALSDGTGDSAIGIGGRDWSSEAVELPASWAILLYTDGIVEGRIGDGSQRLGETGLHRMIEQRLAEDSSWAEHPSKLLEDLLRSAEQANGGSLSDDVAMLMVGAGEPAGP
jgi:serine phosphatase RsbU (regulator of sigma subunit)